jgi:hypothetical protein
VSAVKDGPVGKENKSIFAISARNYWSMCKNSHPFPLYMSHLITVGLQKFISTYI